MNLFVSRKTIPAALPLLAVMVSFLAAQPASAESKDTAPVACAASSSGGLNDVWGRYVEGLRQGDLDQLQSVFAEQGTFVVVSSQAENNTETLSVRQFSEVLPGWIISGDETANGRLDAVSVDHNMATVRGSLDFGSSSFTDVLTLYCLNGQWQIVGKLTYGEARKAK